MSGRFAVAMGVAFLGLARLALAVPFVYTADLSGAAEDPPNASTGTGTATVTFDPTARTLRVQTQFSGLIGNVTVAHIHAPTLVAGAGTASVATQTPSFAGFPTGATFGTYDNTFDTSLAASWNAAFITANGGTVAGAEAAFLQALNEGKAYLNIHSSQFPAGEIRGFLVPEPAGMLVLGTACTLGLIRRRRDTSH